MKKKMLPDAAGWTPARRDDGVAAVVTLLQKQ